MATTSYDWTAHHALVRPDKEAVWDVRTDRRWTYAQFDARVEQVATVLQRDFGVNVADRVAVYAQNTAEIFEVQFACWKLGAIFVPLNWRLAGPELEYIAQDCTPKVLIHESGFTEAARALAAAAGIDRRLVWDGAVDGSQGGGTGAEPDSAAPYEEALASVSRADFVRADATHDTPLTVMYTSGTTGRPKGAIITHGMTFWTAVNQLEFFRTGPDMVNLAILPLFHTGGLNVFANPAFHWGGRNVVVHTFDPAAALALLDDAEVGITHFLGVPAHWLFMSQSPGFAQATLSTAVGMGVGGSPTPVELIRTWLTKGVVLQQAFGMTETSPIVMSQTREDAVSTIGAAGMAALHNTCRIVDETGGDVARGEIGELWVKGPNITPGYWNHPQATADAITDGWLHTGDAARQDEAGNYSIVDRWKDMYISGGENVYPAEVENVIYQVPGVAECAVIGVPDERWVEVGRAVIVRAPGSELDEAAVLRHCVAQLARFKVPKSVVFIDELPHNATGKILKRELRDHHGA